MNWVKQIIKRILLKIPYIKSLNHQLDNLKKLRQKMGWKPGHYYSPIPDLQDVEDDKERIFNIKETPLDIDLNIENQLNLLYLLERFYEEYPYHQHHFDEQKYRYTKNGAIYRYSDAVFLYSMIRHFEPKNIIEIGSGHSSAIMLDTNEHFFDNKIKLTFIEPNPEDRLTKILKATDIERCTFRYIKVQNEELDTFEKLRENDILFIDSSHVSKVGSDLNHVVFNVLPRLAKGVIIHFHDIFYPFELPWNWIIDKKRFWNENYLLRALLMNSSKYEIINFNTFLQANDRPWFETNMPECLVDAENTGSIWLRKL